MSLNDQQRAATREELRSNLALSGQSVADAASALGLSSAQVQAALDVTGAPPEDVWLLRDYLNRVIRSNGLTPRPYSSLAHACRGRKVVPPGRRRRRHQEGCAVRPRATGACSPDRHAVTFGDGVPVSGRSDSLIGQAVCTGNCR
ncbi:DUF2316 family protein [Cryobacterium suzukii]|uniref:DUF2316 family protein n=1 Tax=Cryobacterium suzukii TaxID=1259198 RepID=A0A4R9AFF2_9MICO|nr:DUF2316 family protein [Cryobacterium suzukii]